MIQRFIPIGAIALALTPTLDAYACGGFFCNNEPIDQTKERIIFGLDKEKNEVQVHVQVFYQGDADGFSWVVPVAGVPEIDLSTDALFQQLDWQTRPYFDLSWEERGTCEYDVYTYFPGAFEDSLDSAESDSDGAGGGVEVVAAGKTGPYDWQVVDAVSSSALLAWLEDPDGDPLTDDAYVVPEGIGEKLGGYLAGGAKFVAFRLNNDSDAGDIAPIKMTYAGDQAMIPLVLTSIAASDDMRLEPYVFAADRAVPDNYLHVRINKAKINWLAYGSNYDDLITEAANEAGGQAFATDFFGSTEPLRNVLFREGQFQTDSLRSIQDPGEFVNSLLGQGFPRNLQMQNLIRDHIEMPQEAIDAGIEERDYYNCLDCYSEYTALITFDPEAFVDELEEVIIEPMRDAEQLFHDFPMVTRMTSSMDAGEMTLDPYFVCNPDMTEPVSNRHEAALIIDCGDGGLYSEALRWLEIPNDDGTTTTIQVPPESWFQDSGESYDSWFEDVDQPAADRIERTSGSGQPTPLTDNRSVVDDAIEAHNAWVFDLTGQAPIDTVGDCGGCSQSNPAGGAAGALGLLGLLGLRRRRT